MALLPTAYFGNIEYYSTLLQSEVATIELYENFPKQSYRNRTLIMTANGVIPIIVPLKRGRTGKVMTKDIAVDYSTPWQRNAWRAITSAYRNSPYFDHYEQKIEHFFTARFDTLVEMNSSILDMTMSIIGAVVDIKTTTSYVHNCSEADYREHFSPKKVPSVIGKPYYQVFSERLPFAENLSIIDLIFCEGTNSKEYIL